MSVHAYQNGLAESAVESYLQHIVHQRDFPALVEHIQELLWRVQEDEITARQITAIILKDVGLSLKVLCTANSVRYNRSGKPILMVNHAVTLMGLEAIRDLAASMLLFEHFRNRSPGLRHLMALSLLTASHARSAAAHIGYPRWEEAYLCGMFRNLGEVLIACYFPREYGGVLAEMRKPRSSEQQACLRVLGFRYEELGEKTVRYWNMPPRIGQSMDPAVRRQAAMRSEEGQLQELANFGHELTTVMHRESPEGLRARMRRLIEVHGPLLDMRIDQMEKIAGQAIEETKTTFEMLQIPLDDLRLRVQMERAMLSVGGLDEDPPGVRESSLKLLRRELEERFGEGDECDLNGLLRGVLGGFLTAGYQRGIFCLVSPDHRRIQARLGVGEAVAEGVAAFAFPIERRRGPLSAALVGRKDVFVADGPWADSTLARQMGATGFGLLPLIVDDVLAGCFYFDCRGADVANPTKAEAAELGALRDLAVRALRARRASIGPGEPSRL